MIVGQSDNQQTFTLSAQQTGVIIILEWFSVCLDVKVVWKLVVAAGGCDIYIYIFVQWNVSWELYHIECYRHNSLYEIYRVRCLQIVLELGLL